MSISSAIAFPHYEEPPADQPGKGSVSLEMLTTLVQVEHVVTQNEIARQLEVLNTFVGQLQHKRQKYRSEKRFLSYLFNKVHRKFLKQYQSHTTLYELMEQGHYDCVTGSALYALLLDALGIPYQVHEFPYHVYLTVTTSEHEVFMIESTDPQYGFVTNPAEQAKRREFYSQATSTDNSEAYYQYDFTIRSTIGLSELAGLSYFNEAVEYYNQRQLQPAIHLLHQADRLYASPRMEAFKALVASLAQN